MGAETTEDGFLHECGAFALFGKLPLLSVPCARYATIETSCAGGTVGRFGVSDLIIKPWLGTLYKLSKQVKIKIMTSNLGENRDVKKVICYIQAFDCEYTIINSMSSILNQTYQNWYCFILSNGNVKNHTFDVIKSFAQHDKRFVLLNKKQNNLSMYIPSFWHLATIFPNDYICSLDSDDEYEEDFFERAIELAERHRLDIVACGTQILLKKTKMQQRKNF